MKIFISYAWQNKEYMQGIKKALLPQIRENKITLWVDEEKLNPAEKFDMTIAKQIKESSMVLLLLSIDFWASDYIQDKEFPLIMQEHKERGLLLFPVILEDISDFSEHRELNGILAYPFDEGNLKPIVDFKIKNRAYNNIAIKIKEIYQKLFKNRYKHLSYFEQEDSPIFYGREKIARELASTTLSLKASLLFGESGVGKTSLILAGVLYELNKEDSFKAIYIRFRKDIIARFKEILAKELNTNFMDIEDILKKYMLKNNKKILLIFDQFEEIFTTVETYQRDNFFRKILLKLKDIPGVHILFSLRADFLWRLNPYRKDFDKLWNKAIGLERLGKSDALRAIINPLESGMIDDFLAEKIYEDLLKQSNEENVYTPFLQLVMFEIYQKAISSNSLKITQKLYNELGGVSGIITNYFDGLLKKFNADEHKLLEKLFFYLVTDSNTRASIKKGELEEIFHNENKIYNLVNMLIEDRVIRRVTDIDEYYELVHDILAEHISKRFNLRQNIKHLSNRLKYLSVSDLDDRYLSEKEVYEILIYKKLFNWNENTRIQIIRGMIKYLVNDKEWIENNLKLFYKTLFKFLESKESRIFLSGLKAAEYYHKFIGEKEKKKIYQIIKNKDLSNNDSQSYWILNLLLKLDIKPDSNELLNIFTLVSDFNSSLEIVEKSVFLMLKYDFKNEKFTEVLESDIIFDFLTSGKKDEVVKKIILAMIDNMGIEGYLKYMLEKLDIYASDNFSDEDDDILMYKYALIMVESFCEYIGDNIYFVKTFKYKEEIEAILTRFYIILTVKKLFELSFNYEYEKLLKRLEILLLGQIFEFDKEILIENFINYSQPLPLNKKVAFKLASVIQNEEELYNIIDKLGKDNNTLRQNAYLILRYKFNETIKLDLKKYKNIEYDEIKLFLNFDTKERLFKDLSLINKDIQIKRLELYFDSKLAYEQLEMWENIIDSRLLKLNRNIEQSLKNIMVGSLEMKDNDFRAIKESLSSFLSFFNIDLMFNKLNKVLEKSNNPDLNAYINRIRKKISDYHASKENNQVENTDIFLEKIVLIYKEFESKYANIDTLEPLNRIKADIKFIELYLEAKNLDLALNYWLDYITDMIYLLIKENGKEEIGLKVILLQKMVKFKMYENLGMLFKDKISREGVDEEFLEREYDWLIYDTLLECCYDLKVNISLSLLDKFLASPQVRIKQFAFKLLIIHSKIGKEIKRARAFKFLEDITLRIFALELLAEIGEKEDILKLIEFRNIQDTTFQKKLEFCIDSIMENSLNKATTIQDKNL